jgi:hypothetical protein
MADVDFDGTANKTFNRTLVKNDVYIVTCIGVDDTIRSFKAIDKKSGKERDRRRILIRWELPDKQEIVQWTSIDVKKGNAANNMSPTGSYSFLELSGELDNFKKMCAGKQTVDDSEVLNFFKARFIGRKARITTKVSKSDNGQEYSSISQFLEVMGKA